MDRRFIQLYDAYTHGGLSRRDFLERLAGLAGSAAAAQALLPILQNDYAGAPGVEPHDPRLAPTRVAVPGVEGLQGYLVRPAKGRRLPAVLVVHENRGLNPHIQDVTRRLALEGFLALGLDYLSPLGGTPSDEDAGRKLIAQITPERAVACGRAALAYLRGHPEGNGRAGALGFCWGGAAVHALAVQEPALDAGVVYYGMPPRPEDAAAIRAPLLLHFAELDERINAAVPAFEAALKAGGKVFTLHRYPGVNHAFNNDTNAARHDPEAARLAWGRTLAFLHKHLG